jgi:uncharacterized protein (TIGR00730 family)
MPASNLRSLCVFCGSSPGFDAAYQHAARALGRLLAERSIQLVYGGGNVGLMGTLSEAVMEAGGEVVGVIPQALLSREKGKRDITRLEVVDTMHQRKARMAELSDGFVALPGGYGTLEEFCEIVTWSQLGIHAKPVALLNVKRFYDGLLALLDHSMAEGFLQPKYRELVLSEIEPADLLDTLQRWRAPDIEPWAPSTDVRLGT